MRFLVDESVDIRIGAYLVSVGHDATTVAEDYEPSIADTEVLDHARREGRVVITNDRDFGELVFRHHQAHSGVIYFRLGTFELAPMIRRLNAVLDRFPDQIEEFIVVTPHRMRVRSRG